MNDLKFEQAIIALLKSAIDGSQADMSTDMDWEQAMRLGQEQSLIPLIYFGAMNSGITPPASFEHSVLAHILIDQKQQYAVAELCNAFEKQGIAHMPVKGVLLRQMYPNTEMRPMGDADILVRIEQKMEVFSLMDQLGYVAKKESAHEWVFCKGDICIELHKSLIPSYSKDYYAYFGDGWKFAQKTRFKNRYEMRPEDHFVYMITHFAKHYRAGGIGALHMVDFWVYMRSQHLQMDYVRAELNKLDLVRFCNNILKTVDVWFNGGSKTEMTDFITCRIFGNGSWGTQETHAAATAVKVSKSTGTGSLKLVRGVKTVLPPLQSMQYRYPILKKHKYLLPFMWVARWGDVLFFKRDRLRNKLDELKMTTEENVSSYQAELNYVGLDFNYKE